MTQFLDTANAWLTSRTDESVRRGALDAFVAAGLPTTTDEVWRYAPLADFDLNRYSVATPTGIAPTTPLTESIAALGSIVVRTLDGVVQAITGDIEGVTVTWNETRSADSATERYAADSLATLNWALMGGQLTIQVAEGVNAPGTIVLLHAITGSAVFPNVSIHVGRSATANVAEVWFGGADALVVPCEEYHVADNGSLTIATYQRLEQSAWYVSRTTALLQRDARVHQSVIGMGAKYDRARNDAVLQGTGAQNELWTTYLGQGDQVHDLRSHQMHEVGRTESRLLSKGAVAEQSRSIYTGLIEIERGARRTDARQTNHNLLLSPHAHADTVPNLDIRENDVTCAHASSVGPLDELQRWYLESRGVTRHDAERLMIQGFFNEMLDVLPNNLARLLEADIAGQLEKVAVV